MKQQHSWMTLLLAAVTSTAIWVLTPVLTNHREPWDSEGSFYLVALGIAGAFAGALAGQLGYELIFLRVGPLILIGAVFLLVYCAIFTLAAALAAFVRGRVAKRFGQLS